MNIYTLHGISTIFVMLAFIAVCWWAFTPKHKKRFNEAANLPFSDEQLHRSKVAKSHSNNTAGTL